MPDKKLNHFNSLEDKRTGTLCVCQLTEILKLLRRVLVTQYTLQPLFSSWETLSNINFLFFQLAMYNKSWTNVSDSNTQTQVTNLANPWK